MAHHQHIVLDRVATGSIAQRDLAATGRKFRQQENPIPASHFPRSEVSEPHQSGSSAIEFSVSVCMVIPAGPSPDPLKLIFIVPLTVPSTTAPRESENT